MWFIWQINLLLLLLLDKAPNTACQNYIHSTLVNSNYIQIDSKTRRHSYHLGPNAMLSLVASWWVSYISHIIKTVPQFSVYSHSDNNESEVIRILPFLCDALLVLSLLCLSFCPYSLVALNCDRRKIRWSNVSSDIRQRRTVRTWALTKFLHYC